MATTVNSNGEASSAFSAALAAAGYTNQGLSELATVQLAIANLITSPVFTGATSFADVVTITNATEATSGGAGALKLTGGLYVAKKVFSIGDLTVGASTFVVTAATGAVTHTGSLTIAGAATATSQQIRVYGVASGTASGSSVNVSNGSSAIIAIGNYSNIIGGAYSAVPTIWWGNDTLTFYGNGASRLTIASTGAATFAGTVQTGALTTDGGLQTFGANDSAGAGYRLVRVPNV